MRAYGYPAKSGSVGRRVGTHPDGCICKVKKIIKKRARREARLALKKYTG